MDIDNLILSVGGMTTSTCTNATELTAAGVLENMRETMRKLEESASAAPAASLAFADAVAYGIAGLKVYASDLCDVQVPARRHKRRRGQSAAYHWRVQKKWTKRYGMTIEHRVFMLPNGFMGGGSPSAILMSRVAIDQLRAGL